MDNQEKILQFFTEDSIWKDQVNVLREIALTTEVEETYKWMFPTYTIGDKNVFSLAKFNDWCGIWFFQGVFLSDPLEVLSNAQEGKTKAMRHWKFINHDPLPLDVILAYYKEAIQNQKDGKVVRPTKKKRSAPTDKPVIMPILLVKAFEEDVKLSTAFNSLSHARKRDYAKYISEAKQTATKEKRLDKIIPLILEGKGIAALWGG